MYASLWRNAEVGDINSFERVAAEHKQEININWSDEDGDTFLITASHAGHANMLHFSWVKGR